MAGNSLALGPPVVIGNQIIELSSVNSTNTYLQELALNQFLPEGTVVTALHQTSGRGQRGTAWNSEKGQNILLSIFLKPAQTCNIKASEAFILSQAIALGVHDFISSFTAGFETSIKWPNDILVERKKIAGILIENSIQGQELQTSIIGIGLNLNQTEDLPETAISLKILTGKNYSLKEMCKALFAFLEKHYLYLKENNYEEVRKEYLKYLYGFGKPVLFSEAGNEEIFAGLIKGVDMDGRLLIQDPPWSGALKKYDLKEIRFV